MSLLRTESAAPMLHRRSTGKMGGFNVQLVFKQPGCRQTVNSDVYSSEWRSVQNTLTGTSWLSRLRWGSISPVHPLRLCCLNLVDTTALRHMPLTEDALNPAGPSVSGPSEDNLHVYSNSNMVLNMASVLNRGWQLQWGGAGTPGAWPDVERRPRQRCWQHWQWSWGPSEVRQIWWPNSSLNSVCGQSEALVTS